VRNSGESYYHLVVNSVGVFGIPQIARSNKGVGDSPQC
jgi:hypothetical protein